FRALASEALARRGGGEAPLPQARQRVGVPRRCRAQTLLAIRQGGALLRQARRRASDLGTQPSELRLARLRRRHRRVQCRARGQQRGVLCRERVACLSRGGCGALARLGQPGALALGCRQSLRELLPAPLQLAARLRRLGRLALEISKLALARVTLARGLVRL